jgi:Sulfotransferase domain
MNAEITIVSGLPRSGTSVMMQMLDQGGMEVVTDHVRTADTDNPRGYYEYEIVKKIKNDTSWLPATRGKAFKMVSQLLYDLPPSETYRVVFMERDLEEVLVSQEKMLKRLGRPVAPHDQIMQAYKLHLQKLHAWIKQQKNINILCISYNDLMERPQSQAERVSEFLQGKTNVEGMVSAVDTSLYRNRKNNGDLPTAPALGSSP